MSVFIVYTVKRKYRGIKSLFKNIHYSVVLRFKSGFIRLKIFCFFLTTLKKLRSIFCLKIKPGWAQLLLATAITYKRYSKNLIYAD